MEIFCNQRVDHIILRLFIQELALFQENTSLKNRKITIMKIYLVVNYFKLIKVLNRCKYDMSFCELPPNFPI